MNDQVKPLDERPRMARKLGKMERSAWIYDRAAPFNLGSAIDLHGDVGEAGLKQVLRWCQTRHPLLRSVVRQQGNNLYFACYEPADAPEIPLEIASSAEDDRDRIATEELRAPFDGFREVMIRVKLVRFAADHCAMFITFQHLIGDGFSAANLMMDIVNLLGDVAAGEALPPAQPLPFPPVLEDGISPRFKGLGGLFKMVGCQAKVNGRMKQLGGMPVPLRTRSDVPFAERVPTIETFSLDAEETAALIEKARQEKLTLYALLIGIVLDIIHPFLADGKNKDTSDRVVVMPVPTNIRPFLSIPTRMDFGFYASAIDVVLKLTGKDDIGQLARAVRSEIKSGMTKDSPRLYVMPSIAAIMDWKPFFPTNSKGISRAARFIDSMAQYSSTSLTFLNFQRLSPRPGGLAVSNARGYVAPSMLARALFSAVLCRDVLNIHLVYNDKQFSSEDAAQLKQSFRDKALALARTGKRDAVPAAPETSDTASA
jgi:hypothetical protein